MSKSFTLRDKINLKVVTRNFKNGEKIQGHIKLLDEDKKELAKKEFEVEVNNYKAKYLFITEKLAKSLKVKSEDIYYIKGWMDSDSNRIIDYEEEVILEITFGVRDIPNVMKNKLNWPKSAELMELWFSLDEKEMTMNEKDGKTPYNIYNKKYVNTTIFTMDWLLGFKRVQEGFNNIKKTIYNESAKRELEKIFNKNIQNGITFTDIKDLTNLHKPWQFQKEVISYEAGVMDDLYGSLGNFALYAAVSNYKVKKLTSNLYKIIVTEVVVYMKDTYEFIGEQYLGHWNNKGMGINPVAGLANKLEFEWNLPAWNPKQGLASSFGNSDFREYREKNKKGGDLLLFSNTKKLTVNISFNIKV